MPTFNAVTLASAQTQLGLAVETVRGTPVAPQYWVPVLSPKYKPDIVINDDKAFRGSMVEIYDIVRGQRYDGHGWDSHPYMDHFPILLRALLGSSDNLTPAPTSTTTTAPSVVGATTLAVGGAIPTGSYIVVGTTTGTLETAFVSTGTTAAGNITLEWPLIYAHPSGTAVTGLTKHQFSLLNNAGSGGDQPPSVTITDFGGDQWRQMSGCQLDQLTIKGTATGLIEYTVTWLGNAATTPTPPTATYGSVEAPPGWSSQIFIGGTYVQYFSDWTFDFKRNTKPVPAFTGTQNYLQFFAGPLDLTMKLTVIEQGTAPELAEYLNGTDSALDFTFFDTGSGDACNIHSTHSKWRTGELNRSKEWVEATLDAQMLPSATDALAGGVSPVLMTVANTTTTSY